MLRTRVGDITAYLLILVLAVELAVWESFLVAARPFGQPLPVAALLAVVANLALGRAAGRVLRTPRAALGPALVWLFIALGLGTSRPEGDVIVTGTGRGLAFLVLGTVSAAAAIGMSRTPRATPQPSSSR